jgi:uncharacterized protein YecT (DUF1311 family)
MVGLGAGPVAAHSQPQDQKDIDDSKAAAQSCDGPQIALEECESNIYHLLDTRMNDLYKKQMTRLGPESKAALRDAQRAWLVFRDKSCDYEAGKDPRGSMETIQYFCLQGITRHRIEDLASYLECTQNGCPSD